MAEMVELKNIHKSFGSNHILKGVNMSIEKGEVVVILGPSGSGKTTLLRTINFLDAADEGTISVSGFEVDAKKHSKSQVIELRRKTAMVFQNYNLFANKTILENVMEGLVTVKKFKKSDAKEMSLEILKKVGLEQRCDFYPAQLSGGQQQRAGIARALILDPDVILFDEPTSALDPELVGEVLNTIKAVAQTGITMIVVTHEIAFAREVASRVVFMEGGVVVEEGKPEEILVAPKHPSTQRFLKRITNPNAE
jgi:L-cystine transport system ATP-binding protein